MATETVLLTGSTGYIGSLVLLKLLGSGRKVRSCVRSITRGSAIENHPLVAPHANLLEFVEIPDFEAPKAFHAALVGIDSVIHLASPIPADGMDGVALFEASLKPSQELVRAAHRIPECRVKRIVLASSGVAVFPVPVLLGGNFTDKVYNIYTRLLADEITQSPYPHPGIAYHFAKATLLAWAENFVEIEKPEFDIISLMPSWVVGPNPLFTKPEELLTTTSYKILSILLGNKKPDPTANAMVGVDDTARIFCESLDRTKVKGSDAFLICRTDFEYNDALSIAKTTFPDAVKTGILPLGGDRATLPSKADASDTEKIFGELASYEDCVKATVDQYLDLVEKCGVPKMVTSGQFGGATTLNG